MRNFHFILLALFCGQCIVTVSCKQRNTKTEDNRSKTSQASTPEFVPDGLSAEDGEDTVIQLTDDVNLTASEDLSLAQMGWSPNVVPMNMGTQYANFLIAADIDEIAGVGLKYIRIGLNVDRTDDIANRIDPLVRRMWAKGITPFIIIGNSPPPTTADARAHFAVAAKALCERFRDGPVVFELWNEPNGSNFWKPNPDPVAYANFAAEVAAAMKSTGSGHQIVAGDVNNIDQDGLSWLEQVLSTRRDLLNNLDAVSIHGYQVSTSPTVGKMNPEARLPTYNKVRALTTKYGHTLPIVLSEWGWTEGGPVAISPFLHAAYGARMLLTNMYAGIPVSILYSWRDEAPYKVDDRFGFKDCSFKDANGTCIGGNPRPLYWAISQMTQELSNYAYRTRLGSGMTDFVLVFQHISSGAYKAAVWTTGKKHNITVNIKGKPPLVFPDVTGLPKYMNIAPGRI